MAPDTETPAGTLGELFTLASELEAALNALLDHSSIRYSDINSGSSDVFVVGWNPHRWNALAGPGQYALGEARRLAEMWKEHAGKAIDVGAPERAREFEQRGASVGRVLRISDGASDGAPASTIDGVRGAVSRALSQQRELLADLPTAHGTGGRLFVPDTNSLIYQPAIEGWRLAGEDPCIVVLVPQVIRELDELKLREGSVGDAATTMINKLKEYGRRGETLTGVPLKGKTQLREVAIDADMANTLSWLKAGHEDDELLASVLELKWRDLSADVVLITRDRNLQNKARVARVCYRDVEEIAEPRPTPARGPKRSAAEAEEEARSRLGGGLDFARSKLGVPPASTATTADKQSWTVQATPLHIADDFAKRVIGLEAPAWFKEKAAELFTEPSPIPQPPSAPQAGARGFSVQREFLTPQKGSVLLVADAGGLVGARYNIELDPSEQRALILQTVEDDILQPLIRTCAEALVQLEGSGPALIDLWAIGVANVALLTAGHSALRRETDGWLSKGIQHIGGSLDIPAGEAAVEELAREWGRELARAAGTPAWEPSSAVSPPSQQQAS
jgi:PIN domain-containing protein